MEFETLRMEGTFVHTSWTYHRCLEKQLAVLRKAGRCQSAPEVDKTLHTA